MCTAWGIRATHCWSFRRGDIDIDCTGFLSQECQSIDKQTYIASRIDLASQHHAMIDIAIADLAYMFAFKWHSSKAAQTGRSTAHKIPVICKRSDVATIDIVLETPPTQARHGGTIML